MLMMNRLSKVYRAESVETHALRDLNINVRDREFVAVTGPSGSGKTTFLTVAGLLEEFTSGEFELDGINVRGMDDGQRSRLRNEKIGFVFQAFNLIPDLTVSANVELPLHFRSMTRGERRRRAMDALARVGLSSRMNHFPSELSGDSSSGSPLHGRWPDHRDSCSRMSPPGISTPRWHWLSSNCSKNCIVAAPPS